MPEIFAGSIIYLSLFPVMLAGFAVAYLGLRIRDARSETPDPELGIKSAYHVFLSMGVLLILTGLTISAVDFLNEALDDNKQKQQPQPQFFPQGKFGPPMMQPPPQNDDPFERVSQRIAWPLVISGALFALVSILLLKAGTNEAQYLAVRRSFTGLRLVLAGLNVMVGVTLLVELLFQKNVNTMQPYAVAIGLIGIWFPAGAIHLFLLKRDGKYPYYIPPKPKKTKKYEDDQDDADRFDEDRRPRERRRRDDDERESRPRREPPPPPRRGDDADD